MVAGPVRFELTAYSCLQSPDRRLDRCFDCRAIRTASRPFRAGLRYGPCSSVPDLRAPYFFLLFWVPSTLLDIRLQDDLTR